MGRRRRAAKKERKRRLREGIEEEQLEGIPLAAKQHGDPLTAILQLQQAGQYVGVAYGRTVWLQERKSNHLVRLPDLDSSAPVRALAFDARGKLFMAAGDDKTVQVWELESLTLRGQWKCPKKVSAATFTSDGEHAIFADKFGDVYVAATTAPEQAPQLFMGHFCSIITSLTVSPDGHFIVSTDRDHKIRVSIMPARPMQGAHEIQSYCLGHLSFVTCVAFLSLPAGPVLISGAGDGTIRAWDHQSGKQLSIYSAPGLGLRRKAPQKGIILETAPAEAETAVNESDELREPRTASTAMADAAQPQGDSVAFCNGADAEASADEQDGEEPEDEDAAGAAVSDGGYESDNDDTDANVQMRAESNEHVAAAVIALATAPDGSSIAAAIEGQDSITVLQLTSYGQLELQQQLSIPALALPTALQFDADCRLWALGRPQAAGPARLKLGIAGRGESEQAYAALGDVEVPDSLLTALAAARPEEHEGQEGAGSQVNPQLRKRSYPESEPAFRKRNRRDVRVQAAATGITLDESKAADQEQ